MFQNAQVNQVPRTKESLNFDATVAQAVRILRARDSADLAVALAARRIYCEWFIALPPEVKTAAMLRYAQTDEAA